MSIQDNNQPKYQFPELPDTTNALFLQQRLIGVAQQLNTKNQNGAYNIPNENELEISPLSKTPLIHSDGKGKSIDSIFNKEVTPLYWTAGQYRPFLDAFIQHLNTPIEEEKRKHDESLLNLLKEARIEADFISKLIVRLQEEHSDATTSSIQYLHKAKECVDQGRRWVGKMLAIAGADNPYTDVKSMKDIIERPDQCDQSVVDNFQFKEQDGDEMTIHSDLLPRLTLVREGISGTLITSFDLKNLTPQMGWFTMKASSSTDFLIWTVYQYFCEARMYIGEAIGAAKD